MVVLITQISTQRKAVGCYLLLLLIISKCVMSGTVYKE